MELATVTYETTGPIRLVTINRPQVLNALSAQVFADLAAALSALAADASVRCVILTGAGDKAFVAGADIAAMLEMGPAEARTLCAAAHAVAAQIEGLPAPVIAAVGGYALGGGLELALAADFIYAVETAKFGFPEVGLGAIPGFGGTQRLAARVGLGPARELIFTGRVIDAPTALGLGLVNRVVAPGALLQACRETGDLIAVKAPLAVAEAKRAMRLGTALPLERALVLEQELFAGLFATADRREGMQAFVEKRAPQFRGR